MILMVEKNEFEWKICSIDCLFIWCILIDFLFDLSY